MSEIENLFSNFRMQPILFKDSVSRAKCKTKGSETSFCFHIGNFQKGKSIALQEIFLTEL